MARPREADKHNKRRSSTSDLNILHLTTHITMAAGQKLYPRATVKKIVKAHSKRNVSKNVDVLVGFLDAYFPVQ